MDKTVKLSSKLCHADNPKLDAGNSMRVDIKGIRQKFENLSSVSESPQNSSEIPVAPTRRKRLNLNDRSNKNADISHLDAKFASSNINMSFTKSSLVSPASVKERTKLFESPTTLKHMNSSNLKSIKSTCDLQPLTQNSLVFPTSCTKTVEKINVNSPPAKPPRSFLHLEPNNENNLNSELSKNSVFVHKGKQTDKSELKTKNDTSFNHRPCTKRPVSEILKYGNSEAVATNAKTFQSTPKQKFSGKKPVILNCFKNISSTANNICEKVKQKHSNIFVDLTPTTVSPPKHYGTLKRSLSDEHIYAEPADVCKTSKQSPDPKAVEPLHYMCTSLIPPNVPPRERTEDNPFTSNLSVKNMIYGSFAGLRTTSKDSMENISNSSSTDNTDSDLSAKAIEARIIYVKSVRKQVSSSSICLAPKLYEALFIINAVDNQPEVTHSFPLKVNVDYNIPLLPHICFPHSDLWKSVFVYQSEVFNFSLIEKNETIFGYCLRIQGWPDTKSNKEPLCVKLPVAICILSSFSAPVFYKKLLLEIEKHLTLPRNICFKYIRSLQKLGVPNAGASLSIPDCSEQAVETDRIIVSRPLDSHFVGCEMTRTLQLLDVDILVKCVASLFLERRILFFSSSTSNLYHCCKAITSLLYPFEWPHLIVPVLPACLTIHCCSEQPYVLGIINNNCKSVLELLAEHELLIIDVDKGTILKSCNDEDTILPRKVQKAVISALNLAKNMTDPTEMLRDIMISEAFVHMSVEMIGHYENHFAETNGAVTFQKENFLKNVVPYSIRSFLQWFTETQMFDAFIEDSLWRIKYRNICQTNMRTFFEKRVDEYKWELSHSGEKLSRFIEKTVRNFGEMLKGFKKS